MRNFAAPGQGQQRRYSKEFWLLWRVWPDSIIRHGHGADAVSGRVWPAGVRGHEFLLRAGGVVVVFTGKVAGEAIGGARAVGRGIGGQASRRTATSAGDNRAGQH